MKKFSVLIAVALLAVAGTGYAVTCAQDYVPAASLLVPHFRVSRNNSQLNDIATCATCTNTLIAIVNVSTPGVIAHVTVWNKYSRPVLDFNVPLTGKDVAFLDMRRILNGDLNNINVNSLLAGLAPVSIQKPDPCGLNIGNNVYAPNTGFGQNNFIRFSHPDSSILPKSGNDAYTSISVYSPTAFSGGFRQKVWDSLDESGDISEFFVSTGAFILDTDNPACSGKVGDGVISGDFSGYLTIDVVNYCTNFFPNQPDFYTKDAIATRGWCGAIGANEGPCFSPNVLFGDVFYIDPSSTAATSSGNVSGDPAVSLEFDVRLEWLGNTNPGPKTFYGRNVAKLPALLLTCETAGGGTCNTFVPVAYRFGGDGREPLGDHYGFRYYSDVNSGPTQTWAIVWREDLYRSVSTGAVQTEQDLCTWLLGGGKGGAGFYDDDHQIIAITYDNDENFNSPGGSGGPSGDTTLTNQLYIFLESQRLTLLANKEINPGYDPVAGKFIGGWIDLTLRNSSVTAPPLANIYYNQAWVGVQHSGVGQSIGVGHLAPLLYNDFVCIPWGPGGIYTVHTEPGNQISP
jgi:hypothetical protein